MARCSRCKNQNWPLHKRKGAVFCESCLGIGYSSAIPRGWFGWFGDVMEWVHDTLGKIRDRVSGVKKVKLDTGAKKFQVAKNFAAKPKLVNIVRIGKSYQKTA